ncbi:hypothetical protein KCU93_g8194, partial [Aureobasidium melanogenum]
MKLFLTHCAVSSALAQYSTNIPPCLVPFNLSSIVTTSANYLQSACMSPYSDPHSSLTCMSNWTSAVSSCIDGTCSVSVSSADANTRTSMFFTPSRDNSCQQSTSDEAPQFRSMLQLQPGICQTSFYPFQSFLISTGQNGIQQDCSLGLFEESHCVGGTREVPFDATLASTGQCWLVGGQSVMLSCGEGGTASDNQAAHMYLSSLCSISSGTPTSTRLQSSTTLIAADTTTVATAVISSSTPSNHTAGIMGDPSTSSNVTSLATTSIAVIIPSVVSISGNSVEKEVVKRGGTAQWALVVVVFARSLMY